MTTMTKQTLACVMCDAESEHYEIMSTNAFGASDLDTRPPEMQRSTLYAEIQRCPHCGYCASDISKNIGIAAGILEEQNYRSILYQSDIPELASNFLAASYLSEKEMRFADAAWHAIHAAWICDDHKNQSKAAYCRKQAVSLIEKANLHSQKIAAQKGAAELISIDLLRRAGLYEQASEMIQNLNASQYEQIIQQIIDYETLLVSNQDSGCYSVEDALHE